jgi:hypothetical protein
LRHVGKSPIVIVSIKPIMERFALLDEAGDARAIGKKDIRVAIVV